MSSRSPQNARCPVAAGVGEQVVDHLAEAGLVAGDDDRLLELAVERPRGIDDFGGRDRQLDDAVEGNGAGRERALFAEAREQQQVLNQLFHARRFVLDCAHRNQRDPGFRRSLAC
jgi:hypothetical protein